MNNTTIRIIVVVFVTIILFLVLARCDDDVTEAEDAIITVCDDVKTISGGYGYATGVDRVTPWGTWDWAKARTELITEVRKEAEEEAQDEFDDIITTVECPDECSKLVLVGSPRYSTNIGLSGSRGWWIWGWYLKYTAWADSEVLQDVKCETESD
jgi:hypothetical protein